MEQSYWLFRTEHINEHSMAGRLQRLQGEGWEVVSIAPARLIENGDAYTVDDYLVVMRRRVN